MANTNLVCNDELKYNFKITATRYQKPMSGLLRDFMQKFIKKPEDTIKFIYE